MIAKMKKIGSRFPSVITLVVVRTTKKIVGPPDPLSWWSCGPLLIKVFVKPCLENPCFHHIHVIMCFLGLSSNLADAYCRHQVRLSSGALNIF